MCLFLLTASSFLVTFLTGNSSRGIHVQFLTYNGSRKIQSRQSRPETAHAKNQNTVTAAAVTAAISIAMAVIRSLSLTRSLRASLSI